MKNTISRIYDVVCKEFSVRIDEISDDTGPGDLAKWDSLGNLRLVMSIESEFDIQLSIDDVVTINSIKDLIEVVSVLVQDEKLDFSARAVSASSIQASHILRIPNIIYCGVGSLSSLKSMELDSVAVILGPSIYANEIFEKVRDLIGKDIKLQKFIRPIGEPKDSDIKELALKLIDFSPKQILAIGGGSTIDTAKLAWLIYEKPDFQLDDVVISIQDLGLRKKASFIAIPTTFGSGSEASSAAAYTRNNETKKTILISHDFLPDKVVLDPALGLSANGVILFSSAFDALTHAIEGYVSIVDNPFLNPIAITSIKEILKALNNIRNENTDIKVLETLCNSAYFAGIIQNHCSVGLTHSFAHQLTGYGISHGIGNAMFLNTVMEYNSTRSNRYKVLAEEIGFNSVKDLMDHISLVFINSKITPNQTIIENIIKDKSLIIAGAMSDVTFRTNPVELSKVELETIFDNTMKKMINNEH